MDIPAERRGLRERFGALPVLLGRAPAWLLLGAGAVLLVLGIAIAVRPLTSLTLLGVYIGISCIVAGVAGVVARRPRLPVWDPVFGIAWIIAGALILAWLGRSLQALPTFLAILLIVSGAGRAGGVLHGPLSSRVLSGSFAAAEIAFGVLALLWPDATIIVIAVLFAFRTVAFAVGLLGRGIAMLSAGHDSPVRAPRARSRTRRVDVLRWVGAACVVALTVGAGVLSHELRRGEPVLDAFYTAPASVPDSPGVLLREEPWPGTAPEGAVVSRILYTTTSSSGDPAVASAIVVVPDTGSSGPRTVVAWDHGTTGVARACAPSLMNDMFQIQGIPAAEEAIANDWVIVATDYTGQGADGDFPYLVGEGEGRSTLDAVRAAHQIDDLELSADTVVWGHSQGGHAALWTAKIAPTYAPELTILGVAALSPAADPWALANLLQEKGFNGALGIIAAWVLVPYSAAYPDVRIDDYVAPAGRGLVYEYAARCVKNTSLLVSALSAMSLSRDQPLYVEDVTSGAAGERLRENEAVGPFEMPVFVGWGSSDEVISPALQHDYVDGLCAQGQPLEYHEYAGFTHMGVLEQGSGLPSDLIAWTQDRVAGAEPVDSCAAA